MLNVFGKGGGQFPGAYTVTVGGILDGASATQTVAVPGLTTATRVFVEPRASLWTGGIVFMGSEPSAVNTLLVRAGNFSGSSFGGGNREIFVFEGENQSLRQTFSLSASIEDADTYVAGVDSQTNTCVLYKTRSAGGSWFPAQALSACKAARRILRTSSANGLSHIVFGAEEGKVFTTTDGFSTISDRGRLGSEDVLFWAEQEGGEASGVANIVTGSGTGKVWYSTDTGANWTDLGVISVSHNQVWGLIWLTGSGSSAEYLALLNDSTNIVRPAVYHLTNLTTGPTMTATKLADIDVIGNAFQGFIKLSNGSVLVGLEGGNVYRAASPYSAWPEVWDISELDAAETKPRTFVQWATGELFCVGQDAGFIWRSDNNGTDWVREHRLGVQDAAICARNLANNGLLIGCGQGFVTNIPFKATIYRAIKQFNAP